MALNRVILFGRICKDVDFRQTQSGVSVARFTVACDRQFANKETGKREADFIEVQAWRQAAEFVSRYFSKGDAITVEGSIRNNNYEDKNGVKHYSYVVMADNIGFGGSKSDGQAQPEQRQAAQQNANRQYPAPDGYNALHDMPKNKPAEKLDIGDFEEILSDGSVPF